MISLIFFAGALAQTAAPPPEPSGAIESVVVFPDRAAVTRVLELELEAGLNEVRFQDLPPTLEERTLQASGEGPDGTRILGLDVVTRELAEDRRARVVELETEIQVTRDLMTVERDKQTAAAAELKFLDDIKAASAAQLSAELLFADETVKDATDMAELLRTRIPEVQVLQRAAAIALRDLAAKADALERELYTVRGAPQWSRRDVVVLVETEAAGQAEVELTYVLSGASWYPAYDVRTDGEGGKVSISMNALVQQTTGEDWSDATLSLSTARPSAGISPPELSPFWLQAAYTSLGYLGVGPGGGGYAYDEAGMDDMLDAESTSSRRADKAGAPAPPPPPEPMKVATATVSERAVATTFEVPGAASVPGDGTRRKLRVTDLGLEATYRRVVVPRVDTAVYLVAEATWDQGWPLLAGEASIFLEDAFVGTLRVPQTGTGEELELAFGRDDAVQADVELVEDRSTARDWLGKVTVFRKWTFTVDNGRKTEVLVELRDQIPVSREERYRVRYDGDEPTEQDSEGLMSFDRQLAAEGSGAVTFGYVVRYPYKHPPAVIP